MCWEESDITPTGEIIKESRDLGTEKTADKESVESSEEKSYPPKPSKEPLEEKVGCLNGKVNYKITTYSYEKYERNYDWIEKTSVKYEYRGDSSCLGELSECDEDCDSLDSIQCEGTTLITKDYSCSNKECTYSETQEENNVQCGYQESACDESACNNQDSTYCSGNLLVTDDYSCTNNECSSSTILVDCSEEGKECQNAQCGLAEQEIIKIELVGLYCKDEYVQIKNTGNTVVDMTSWIIHDDGEHFIYSFNSGFSLNPDNTVILHRGSGIDTSTDIYWGNAQHKWNNDGDIATLKDNYGTIIDSRPCDDV